MSVPRSSTIGSVCSTASHQLRLLSFGSTGTHRLGVDPTRRDIQTQLAHADAHSSDTKVAESKHATAIRDDRDLHLVLWQARLEVRDDARQVRQVRRGEVQRRDRAGRRGWRRVDEREILAGESCENRGQSESVRSADEGVGRCGPMTGV